MKKKSVSVLNMHEATAHICSQTPPCRSRRHTRTSTAARRRRKRRRRVRMERRKMTLQVLSQRAVRMRRAPSKRTSRGPADSSSWSGTTPPSPTRTHAETPSSHAHTHTPRRTRSFMSTEPWYKEKNTKKEEFPSAYIWSRFSSYRYLRGGTQCSVVITWLLIFTVYFCIYYIWNPRKTWPAF